MFSAPLVQIAETSPNYIGKNRQEDTGAMIRRYPLWNQYWDDKSAKLGQIDVPIYAVASFSTMLHTEGTIRGFLFSSSKDKWSVIFRPRTL
jgi:predicted acyl esterase